MKPSPPAPLRGTPFFSETQIARLQHEVSGWIGTPFVPGCGGNAAKGVRADCTWVAAPLQRLGAIGAVDWPKRYVVHGGGPAMLDLLTGILARVPGLNRVWQRECSDCTPVEVIAGDVILSSTGTRMHHLSLCLGGNLVAHSWSGKIRLASLDHRRLWHSLYRPFTSSPGGASVPASHA